MVNSRPDSAARVLACMGAWAGRVFVVCRLWGGSGEKERVDLLYEEFEVMKKYKECLVKYL